jgi:hypothetical protein
MRLDSVRSLKREIAAKPPRRARLAVGIVRGPRRGDYCLGVRIHAPRRGGAAVAREIERRAHGECDVRVMRRVAKRARDPRWFRALRRPLEAGLSIGHVRITAGTLGFVVQDDEATYALSNNHVLADVNRGARGDPVVQPGPLDREPDARTVIGELTRFERIRFAGTNRVDAALAILFDGIEFYAGWTEALPGVVSGVEPVSVDDLGLEVSKAGRTTGVTHGEITQVEVDRLRVDMGDDPRRPEEARFDDQFEVTTRGRRAFSAGGDSGSLIVDRSGRARGLLFAGGEDTDGTDYTYANRIETALARLKVELAL